MTLNVAARTSHHAPSTLVRRLFRRDRMPHTETAALGQRDLPALDGVRAVAVISVVVYHLWNATNWGKSVGPVLLVPVAFGFAGVLLFFVLSGFLLFLPYAQSLLHGSPWPSPWRFYRRRALRILPVYFACLATLAALLAVLGFLNVRVWESLGLLALLIPNLSTTASRFVAVIDGPLWTLALEWQFYLMLPWLALALKRICQNSHRHKLLRLLAALIGIAALGLATRLLAAYAYFRVGSAVPMEAPGLLGLTLRVVYGYFGRYLEVFALGMLLSVLYVALFESGRIAKLWSSRLGLASLALSGVTLFVCMLWSETTHVLTAPDIWAFSSPRGAPWLVIGIWVTGLAFALLMFGVLVGPPIVRVLFALPPLRFIGRISYSVYLWHIPIFHIVGNAVPALAVTFTVSVATYYVIERPFLNRRYSSSRKIQSLADPIDLAPPIQGPLNMRPHTA